MCPRLIIFLFCFAVTKCENFTTISKTRSSSLERYQGYINVVIIQFHVPKDTELAAFKFTGSERDLSIFGCPVRDVSVYMKYGSPPVINPDGAHFPKDFNNITKSQIYSKIYDLEFQTNKTDTYINITSPEPGTYYAAAFLSYTDPRYNSITQQGLSPSCSALVDGNLYIKKISNLNIITQNHLVNVVVNSSSSRYFKFYVLKDLEHAILSVQNIKFSPNVNLIIRVQIDKPPFKDSFLKEEIVYSNVTSTDILFSIQPEAWHYLEFHFESNLSNSSNVLELQFILRYFSNRLPSTSLVSQEFLNEIIFNTSITTRELHNERLTDIQPYRQYHLVRESASDSFRFSYELELETELSDVIPLINITNYHFSLLQFIISDPTDTGGTMSYLLAFAPRIIKNKNKLTHKEEPKDNVVVACLSRGSIPVPTWPNKCVTNGISTVAPMLLNSTTKNSSMVIPYAESGMWYATFKLFCGTCDPCNCSEDCQKEYKKCTIDCELNCTDPLTQNCENCVETCSQNIIANKECTGCDCDGPCMRNASNICNSSVIFDISSAPCYFGGCGSNGRCSFVASEGLVYSTCICSNNYRGYDCSDSTLATSHYLLFVELFLLVLSNLFFLPAVYVAYKRKYYVEALSYFAICFFSTFYHACDAGENIISYCLVRIGALQFADFFCALLAIWFTLLAIADVYPPIVVSLLQMTGAIILAFCTTINRSSFWIFALPSCTGVAIVAISWYLKYRKVKQRFVNRRYLIIKLPVGTVLVTVGLIMYSFLQTENNYKYLHSMWHIIMAVSVIILLPKRDTFQPEVTI